MVLHARHGTSAYIVSLKPHSIAVSVDGSLVVSWDRGGRLYSVFDDGVTWRRGLSGQLIEKRRAGDERVRALLEGDAADRVVDSSAGVARTTLERMTRRLVAMDERRRPGRRPGSPGAAGPRVAVRCRRGAGRRRPLQPGVRARRHPAAGPVPVPRRAGHRGLLLQHLHVLRPLPRGLPGQDARGVPAARRRRAELPRRVGVAPLPGHLSRRSQCTGRADGAPAADLRNAARGAGRRAPRRVRVRGRIHRARGRRRPSTGCSAISACAGCTSASNPATTRCSPSSASPGPPRTPRRRSGPSSRPASRSASS